jgi:glycogen debranching enzyme
MQRAAENKPGRTTGLNPFLFVMPCALQLIDGQRASRLVETVETNLPTAIGLRSLAPRESAYVPRYEGGVLQRDGSYHQGTVWPWLIGPFVEAWLRVRKNTSEGKAEARNAISTSVARSFARGWA